MGWGEVCSLVDGFHVSPLLLALLFGECADENLAL
jgi:hypothetical protein